MVSERRRSKTYISDDFNLSQKWPKSPDIYFKMIGKHKKTYINKLEKQDPSNN